MSEPVRDGDDGRPFRRFMCARCERLCHTPIFHEMPGGYWCAGCLHEWRAENRRAIDALHPANRLRLMFGLPPLPDPREGDPEKEAGGGTPDLQNL